jgi:hypothetical protein
MSVVLLILGIVLTAAGIAAIGFGIPLNDFTLSTALYTTGTTALTGGVIVIALSVVVAELGRVAEGLKNRSPAPRSNAAARQGAESQEPMIAPVAQPAVLNQPVIQPAAAPAAPPLPPGPMIAPPAPAVANGLRAPAQPSITARPDVPARQPHPAEAYPPPAPSAVEVSAAAIERLRSSIPRTERPRAEPAGADMDEAPLSPNGAMHHPGPGGPQPRQPEAAPNEPRIAAEDRNGDHAVEALKASRLDFLFRAKPAARPAAQPQQQPENFDAYWPADARQQPGRATPAEPRQRTDQVERQPTYAPPPEPLPQAPAHAPVPAHEPPPAILKSGVVDGMAYTLYADGSIEAKLPHGTVRFGSIAELRAHIESNS